MHPIKKVYKITWIYRELTYRERVKRWTNFAFSLNLVCWINVKRFFWVFIQKIFRDKTVWKIVTQSHSEEWNYNRSTCLNIYTDKQINFVFYLLKLKERKIIFILTTWIEKDVYFRKTLTTYMLMNMNCGRWLHCWTY